MNNEFFNIGPTTDSFSWIGLHTQAQLYDTMFHMILYNFSNHSDLSTFDGDIPNPVRINYLIDQIKCEKITGDGEVLTFHFLV